MPETECIRIAHYMGLPHKQQAQHIRETLNSWCIYKLDEQ